MGSVVWRTFLAKFSGELLEDEEVRDRQPAEVVTSQWLGFPGASESEIAALEKKLGAALPPSYREFLAVTNGWRDTSAFIQRMFGSAEVDWLRVRHQYDVIEPWLEADPGGAIPDEEYLVYGSDQNTCIFRPGYLNDALQISDYGDGFYLLNPKVVTRDGEWEAWFFAAWLPGAIRYPSFRALMEGERERWLEQLAEKRNSESERTLGQENAPTNKERRNAQQIALQGDSESAVIAYRGLADRGDDGAAAALAELFAFQGRWHDVITFSGRLIANPSAVNTDNVFCDMVRLLGRAGRESGNWPLVREVIEKAISASATREYPPGHESARNRYACIFANMLEYASRQGTPPHELLRIFDIPDPLANMSVQQKSEAYRQAVEQTPNYVRHKPEVLAQHCFSLARNMEQENEAIRLYKQFGEVMGLRWYNVVYVAKVLVARGESREAWEIVEPALPFWFPHDLFQVAPVELLVDEQLYSIMTSDRCALALATVRGSCS